MKFIIAFSIGIFFICCKGLRDDSTLDRANDLSVSSVANKEDSLILKACDYFDESSEGGEIRGYYLKKELKRIEVELFGEMGKVYKEFKNSDVPDSFSFEQRHFFYNKPFDEKEVRIVDSVFIIGKSNKGVLEKKITGTRISEDNLNKMLQGLEFDRQRYEAFLKTCASKRD